MSGRATASIAARQSPAESLRHLRLERDRHVAFAFAAADLLIEVSDDGTIIAAADAAWRMSVSRWSISRWWTSRPEQSITTKH